VISSHNGKHHLKWQKKIIRIQSYLQVLSLNKNKLLLTIIQLEKCLLPPAWLGRTMTAKLTILLARISDQITTNIALTK